MANSSAEQPLKPVDACATDQEKLRKLVVEMEKRRR
jgi:hypothetical protein